MTGRDDEDGGHSLGADVGTMVMAGGAAATLNETLKAMESEHHRGEHLLHAGLGAAAVGAGLELVRRATAEDSDSNSDRDDDRGYEHSHYHHCHHHRHDCEHQCQHTTIVLDKARRSASPPAHSAKEEDQQTPHHHHHHQRNHHHKLHLAEEVIGAWGAVKDALGDKNHKGIHAAEALLGAVGLLGEAEEHASASST